MKHIDEGTIHAWLDGALNDAEAKDVSQHTATCAECGALVAEARGLIAGASRILTSLDDVPAVAPKRAPVIASGKPQRFWQASPWVTGIAAALILAVGIKEWIDRPQAKAAFEPVHVVMDSLRAAPIPQNALVDSTLRAPAPRVLTRVRNARPMAQASGAGASVAGLAEEKLVKRNEPAKKDAPVEVAADAVASAKVVAAAPAAPEPAPPSCYRLDVVVVRENFTSGAVTKAAARSVAPSAAPAAAPSVARADQPAPMIVRLDSAGTNRIRVVTSLTGQPLGTWTLEGDTVRALLRTGMRAIPLTNRVTCPTTPQE